MRLQTVELATGPKLHYGEQGDRNASPLVLLHGWPDSWFSFSRVAEHLPRTCRALLIDQRGFGDSDRPDNGYRIQDFAADVVAFLDAVSIPRATIVGHSFGSFVARQFAIAHPERVERLVLIGTGWVGSNAVTRGVLASLPDLVDPVPPAFAREFQASTAFAPIPDAFFERLVTESLKLPARLWRDVFGSIVAYNDVNELPALDVPTLLLWGERDALFAREEQDRLVATIPRARLKVYPGIGHCPNWECPGDVAADLREFCERSG